LVDQAYTNRPFGVYGGQQMEAAAPDSATAEISPPRVIDEFADAATFLLTNTCVNGEVLRLDGAKRFQPK
jgi:hypothetical protein